MIRLLLIALLALPVTATERVNVTDYPSFDDAAIAAKNQAQALSSSAQYGHVYVPAGYYPVETINQKAVWHVAGGVEFSSSNFSGSNLDDLSHLPGSIVKESTRGRIGNLTLGSTDWDWVYQMRPNAMPTSSLNVIATDAGAVAGYATTGDKPYSEGNIAIQGYCVNSSASKQNCWPGYFESNQAPWSGTTTTIEVTSGNYGTYGQPLKKVVPSGVYGPNAGISVGLNISGAAGNGYYSDVMDPLPSSAAVMLSPGPSGAGFQKGIVCTDAALANSTREECLAMGNYKRICWHGAGDNPKSCVKGLAPGGNGQIEFEMWDSSGNYSILKITKDGIVLPSGKVLN